MFLFTNVFRIVTYIFVCEGVPNCNVYLFVSEENAGTGQEETLPLTRGYGTTPTHHHHPHTSPAHHHPAPQPPRSTTSPITMSAPNTPSHPPITSPKSGAPSPVVGGSQRQSPLNRSGVSPASGGGGGPPPVGGSLSSSVASSVVSCDVSSQSAADDDVERLLMLQDRKRHSLTTLGVRS